MGNGLLIVLSGPSGTGKGTACDALMKEKPDLSLSVSCTTRERRDGEIEGIDYFFKNKNEFERLVEQDELLEYANVYSNYYGTPKRYVEDKLKEGKDVLLEIDIQGAMCVKKIFPDGVYLFLIPPSMKELERRIRSRGTETEVQILTRLSKSNSELRMMDEYDYVIVNDNIEKVVYSIKCIIEAEKLKVFRNKERLKHLRNGE